ncbi:MAG TPA: sigma-70 family RNA polymerase sigma factor [Candidatus Polarisedimenticolia bacterium]|nr:sigma-70 family RNA polymerase sigma factor [Candidatus Polarisedimenticolia bacterium]
MDAHEEGVVTRARDGDEGAFQSLVERHSRSLFHLAYRITGNEADAEDVVQETFLKAYRSLDRYESRANFGTWLHRIAANCAVDATRTRKRRGEHREAARPSEADQGDPIESLPSATPAPDRLLMSAEIQTRVAGAMARLTPRERAAFVLRHFEQRSIEEIGATLSLRENATKQSIFRAVRKLREALEPFTTQR